MQYHYPTPQEAGIHIPPQVRKQLFDAGFRHGLEGGAVERVEYLRFSFRMGVRAAKLYLRKVRRAQSIIEFPQRWKFRIKADFDIHQPRSDRHKSATLMKIIKRREKNEPHRSFGIY